MITKEAVINNQVGLHARPATFFIQKANEISPSEPDNMKPKQGRVYSTPLFS